MKIELKTIHNTVVVKSKLIERLVLLVTDH